MAQMGLRKDASYRLYLFVVAKLTLLPPIRWLHEVTQREVWWSPLPNRRKRSSTTDYYIKYRVLQITKAAIGAADSATYTLLCFADLLCRV